MDINLLLLVYQITQQIARILRRNIIANFTIRFLSVTLLLSSLQLS